MIFRDTASQTATLPSRRDKGEVFTKLGRIPGVQMIYVSALACTRHRNIDFITLQRQGRLSFLMFDEVDMVTGDYIDKTKQAAAEIAAERTPTGIVPLIGYRSDYVYYDRAERFGGESKYPLKKMIAFAFDGISSFSVKPLKLISNLGIFISVLSILFYT